MGDRVQVIGHSRLPDVKVDRILSDLGGGGHAEAASAVVRGARLDQLEKDLMEAVRKRVRPVYSAAGIMTAHVRTIEEKTTISDASKRMEKTGHTAFPVVNSRGQAGGPDLPQGPQPGRPPRPGTRPGQGLHVPQHHHRQAGRHHPGDAVPDDGERHRPPPGGRGGQDRRHRHPQGPAAGHARRRLPARGQGHAGSFPGALGPAGAAATIAPAGYPAHPSDHLPPGRGEGVRRLPGGGDGARPADGAARLRHGRGGGGARHRLRPPGGEGAGGEDPHPQEVRDGCNRLKVGAPHRRGHGAHRVLPLPGGPAPGGDGLHPPGPLPPRLQRQRHGHLARPARATGSCWTSSAAGATWRSGRSGSCTT